MKNSLGYVLIFVMMLALLAPVVQASMISHCSSWTTGGVTGRYCGAPVPCDRMGGKTYYEVRVRTRTCYLNGGGSIDDVENVITRAGCC